MAVFDKIGRYSVKNELGRGGMASVYLAHDPLFNREVAVKVMPREFLHDPTFRARFRQEAQTIAALEHRAIVPVYDFGEQDDQPYLVMRYMRGGTLSERLKLGPLSLQDIVDIFGRLAGGLDLAHRKGIIHRDLKPANILFDEEDDPFLTDFGIAKLTESSVNFTSVGIFGTPAYMSPEQAEGKRDLDGRSDIYAMGAILYQALSGRLPYQSDTPMGLAIQHITKPVPQIRDVMPSMSEAVEKIIMKTMAKDRNDRFPNARSLVAALRKASSSPAPPKPKPARVEKVAPPVQAKKKPLAKKTPEKKVPLPQSKPKSVTETIQPPPISTETELPAAGLKAAPLTEIVPETGRSSLSQSPKAPVSSSPKNSAENARSGLNWLLIGGGGFAILVFIWVGLALNRGFNFGDGVTTPITPTTEIISNQPIGGTRPAVNVLDPVLDPQPGQEGSDFRPEEQDSGIEAGPVVNVLGSLEDEQPSEANADSTPGPVVNVLGSLEDEQPSETNVDPTPGPDVNVLNDLEESEAAPIFDGTLWVFDDERQFSRIDLDSAEYEVEPIIDIGFEGTCSGSSPDNQHVIIETAGNQLSLINNLTNQIETLDFPADWIGIDDCSWVPNSSKILLTVSKSFATDTFVVNRDGTGLQQLDIPDGLAALWSPVAQDDTFVYRRGSGTIDLVQLDQNFGVVFRSPIYTAGEANLWNYAWHPSGDYLVLSTTREDGSSELIELTIETGVARSLYRLENSTITDRVQFSPDGNFITLGVTQKIENSDERLFCVCVIDLVESEVYAIAELDTIVRPAWSYDGKYIVYSPNQDGIYIANVDTENIQRISNIDADWSEHILWLP